MQRCTRLDNDDAVYKGFVAQIQKDILQLKYKECFISFINGMQYCTKTGRVLKINYSNNHFISLAASKECLGEHVFGYNHFYIGSAGKPIIYKKTRKPMWIEVVHSSNVSNELRWRFRSICIPYKTKDYYPFLELNYNSIFGWVNSFCLGIAEVFWYRSKGFVKIIRRKIRR